jgi:hypothetical protein
MSEELPQILNLRKTIPFTIEELEVMVVGLRYYCLERSESLTQGSV